MSSFPLNISGWFKAASFSSQTLRQALPRCVLQKGGGNEVITSLVGTLKDKRPKYKDQLSVLVPL